MYHPDQHCWLDLDYDKHIKQLFSTNFLIHYPDSKVHGANMGPIWGQQDPGGPHVGPVNFPIPVANYMLCSPDGLQTPYSLNMN